MMDSLSVTSSGDLISDTTTPIPTQALIDLLAQSWASSARVHPFINPCDKQLLSVCATINQAGTPCRVVARGLLLTSSKGSAIHRQLVYALCASGNKDDVFNLAGASGWDECVESYKKALFPEKFDKSSWQNAPLFAPQHVVAEAASAATSRYVKNLKVKICSLAQKTALEDGLQETLESGANILNQARKF